MQQTVVMHVGVVSGMGWAIDLGRVIGVTGLDTDVRGKALVVVMLGRAAEELHAFQAANLDLFGSGVGCRLSGGFGLAHGGSEFAKNTAEDGGAFSIRTVGGCGNGGYGVDDSLEDC